MCVGLRLSSAGSETSEGRPPARRAIWRFTRSWAWQPTGPPPSQTSGLRAPSPSHHPRRGCGEVRHIWSGGRRSVRHGIELISLPPACLEAVWHKGIGAAGQRRRQPESSSPASTSGSRTLRRPCESEQRRHVRDTTRPRRRSPPCRRHRPSPTPTCCSLARSYPGWRSSCCGLRPRSVTR